MTNTITEIFNAVSTAGNREFESLGNTVQWTVTGTKTPKKVVDISAFGN